MKWGAASQIDLKYTKEGAKAGFLYGLAGLVYFSLLFLSAIFLSSYISTIRLNQCVLLLLILGFALFSPMYIISYLFTLLLSSLDVGLSICLFPFNGAVVGAACGILVDIFGRKEETDYETEKEKEIFTRIPFGKNRQVAVREKTVNKCIIAGIVLWAVIIVSYLVFIGPVPRP